MPSIWVNTFGYIENIWNLFCHFKEVITQLREEIYHLRVSNCYTDGTGWKSSWCSEKGKISVEEHLQYSMKEEACLVQKYLFSNQDLNSNPEINLLCDLGLDLSFSRF